MQGKRFVAPNMRLALKMVREELGDDAVILSNKQVPEGVELLTAIDTDNLTTPMPDTTPTQGVAQAAPHQAPAQHQNPTQQQVNVAPSSRFVDNPFVQSDAMDTGAVNREASQPSRLELEVERMRSQARQKAQHLAAALGEKYKLPDQQQDQLKGITQSTFSISQAEADKIRAQLNNTGELPDALVQPDPTTSLTTSPTPETTPETTAVSDGVASAVGEPYKPSMAGQSLMDNPSSSLPESTSSSTLTPASPSPSNNGADVVNNTELEQMRHEMQSMRDLLEQQLSNMAWGQYSFNNPGKASQWRRLKRMGIAANVANSLVESVNACSQANDSWQEIMANLSRRLPVINNDMVVRGGVFAFVGPAGAGKTTTIGKLAARYVLKHGAEDVALVTLDTMRIAAQEQLRTVARILNVPIKVVDKNNTLDRVLHALRRKSLVLIDTAGLNPADIKFNQQISAINELGDHAKSLLVIPATSQEQVIKAAFHTYKTDNLAACVLTKLDETSSLGASICLAIDKKLPVAYSTDGQNIPDDIAVADKVALIKTAIKLAKNTEVDESDMADEMTSLSRGG